MNKDNPICFLIAWLIPLESAFALAGIFMNQTVAWRIKNYSYDYCFYHMLLLHPAALPLVWTLRKRPVAA